MQNVLPRSGARAYKVSDDASADQHYFSLPIFQPLTYPHKIGHIIEACDFSSTGLDANIFS